MSKGLLLLLVVVVVATELHELAGEALGATEC